MDTNNQGKLIETKIISYVSIYTLPDQNNSRRNIHDRQPIYSHSATTTSSGYVTMGHSDNPDLYMNQIFEQLAHDVKRKGTIRKSKKYNGGRNKNYPQNAIYNDPRNNYYQENYQSTSSNSFQQPPSIGDKSNKNIYINENVSDYDNDNANKEYSLDDGIRVFPLDKPSHDNLELSSERDILDEEESSPYDNDSMINDEKKELFELLMDEEELTPEQSYILGYLYESGEVVDPDYKQAFKHYKYASDHGDISATCNLGYLYENGYNSEGLKSERNYPAAIELYTKAAQRGNAQAQYNLATLYERGYGTKENILEAIHFYKDAADQDHHEAQANLAFLYFKRNDYKNAYKYYLEATKGGVPRASFALGYLYQFGLGVNKSHKLAQGYYKEALKKGYSLAKKNIEIMEKGGSGTDSLPINTDNSNIYDEYFNFGDACLGGINREQDIGLAYNYYNSEMKMEDGKGSVERGLAMYYQYCEPDSDQFQSTINLYLLSIELGHTASLYFLGMLLLQNQFFEAARTIFEKLLARKPQNNNAYYLFVKNEDEFMDGKRPVAVFTKISEQNLFMKAKERLIEAEKSLGLEIAMYQQYSRLY
ncbi:HCP-like protein [Backusella circina FSU 941]|nr:HCP-like protein [Backusella circina FSU 941]